MVVVEILTILITFLVVKYFYKWIRFIYMANKIPKSSLDTSIKNLWNIATGDTKTFFEQAVKEIKANGLTRSWFGSILMVNVTSPDDIKIVLNSKSCLSKQQSLNRFTKLPEGLLSCPIDRWHLHRKILNPFFGQQLLRSIIPIFNKKVKAFMENLTAMKDKEEFDIFHLSVLLTIDNILSVMEFDVNVQNQNEKLGDFFIKNLNICSEVIMERILKWWLHPDFIFNKTKLYKKQLEAASNITKASTVKIMEQIRNNQNDDEIPKTFIRALMDRKNGLSDGEIHDEICTFLMTAPETSALTSSAVLLMLAMHKNVQNKLLEELKQVLGTSTDDLNLSMEQLNELQYLEMVINETLRLIPIATVTFRTNETDLVLSEGYVVPAKSNLLIPIYSVHRDKSLWGEDADQFIPERFEKEKFEKIHPYAFIPFSKGPRMCLGWRYSMLLMKVQLANIILKYKIDTKLKFNELKFQTNPLLYVCQGYLINVEKRNFK